MSNQPVRVGDGDGDAARCGLSEPRARATPVRRTQSSDTQQVLHNMHDRFRAEEEEQEPQSRPAGPNSAMEATAVAAAAAATAPQRPPAFTLESVTAATVPPLGFTQALQHHQPGQAGLHRAPALPQAHAAAASHGHASPTAGMALSHGVESELQQPGGAAGVFHTAMAPYGTRPIAGPGASGTGMQRAASGPAVLGPQHFAVTGAGALQHLPRSHSQPGSSPVLLPQSQPLQLQVGPPYPAGHGSPTGLGRPGHVIPQLQPPQHPQQAPQGHLPPGIYLLAQGSTGPQAAYPPPPLQPQQQPQPFYYHHSHPQAPVPPPHLQLHLLHPGQQQQQQQHHLLQQQQEYLQQQQQPPTRVYRTPQQLQDECAAITRELSSSSGGSKAAGPQHKIAQLLWALTQQGGSLGHLGLATSVPDPPPDKGEFTVTAGYPQDSRTNPTGAAAGPKPHAVQGSDAVGLGTFLVTFYSPRCLVCVKTYTSGEGENTCQSLEHPVRRISIYKLAYKSLPSSVPPEAASKLSFKDPDAPASQRRKTDLWVPHQPQVVGWFVRRQETPKPRGRKRKREAEGPQGDAAPGNAGPSGAAQTAGRVGAGADAAEGVRDSRTGEQQPQPGGDSGGGGGDGSGAGGGGGGAAAEGTGGAQGQGGGGNHQGGGGEGSTRRRRGGDGGDGGRAGGSGSGGGSRGSGGRRDTGGDGGSASGSVSYGSAVSTCSSSSGGAEAGVG